MGPTAWRTRRGRLWEITQAVINKDWLAAGVGLVRMLDDPSGLSLAWEITQPNRQAIMLALGTAIKAGQLPADVDRLSAARFMARTMAYQGYAEDLAEKTQWIVTPGATPPRY